MKKIVNIFDISSFRFVFSLSLLIFSLTAMATSIAIAVFVGDDRSASLFRDGMTTVIFSSSLTALGGIGCLFENRKKKSRLNKPQ